MTVAPPPDAGDTGGPAGPPPLGARVTDPWPGWAADLAQAVRSLADGASLTLTAGDGDARPVLLRRSRLRGLVPARHAVVAPWVRLVRVEDHLRGRCVGPDSVGGPFPFSPDEDSALLDLGWHHPARGEGHDYVRFWPDDVPQGPFLPSDEVQRAVTMVESTFRRVLLRGAVATPPAVTT